MSDSRDPPPPGTEAQTSSSSRCDKLRRSRSPDRRRRHKRSSHTRYNKRSRSRHRRRRYSSSSRSRSPQHGSSSSRHKHRRHHKRSRSKSRQRSKHRRSESVDEKPHVIKVEEVEQSRIGDETDEEETDEEQATVPFKNDGSFLEMFKKLEEEKKAKEAQEEAKKTPLMIPMFGKRRGGKVLKTGMVAKTRTSEDDPSNAQDAWSLYMKEVRKYKEVHCDDDSKTRPLVK